MSKVWCGVWLVAALTGCGHDPEDTCKAGCEYAQRCGDGEDVSCDLDECVEQLEQFSEACQDALGDFYDCVDDVGTCNSNDLQSECGSEAGAVLEACGDEELPSVSDTSSGS